MSMILSSVPGTTRQEPLVPLDHHQRVLVVPQAEVDECASKYKASPQTTSKKRP
jgi:hypothetical protein